MTAPLLRSLARELGDGNAVCLAVVTATRGAVPRHRGSMMWVSANATGGTVGGGQLELRVIAKAQALLASDARAEQIEVDLSGGPDSAGVCGGRVILMLSRWSGTAAADRARFLADGLDAGQAMSLSAEEIGASEPLDLPPEPLLLILGAGHCGVSLAQAARLLGWRLAVYDTRAELLEASVFHSSIRLTGDATILRSLAAESRLYAVLLNRDFHADIACLAELAELHPEYVGMMGSRKRVFEVRSQVPDLDAGLPHLDAPLGVEIGAETPEEIAISILARLIAHRRLKSS